MRRLSLIALIILLAAAVTVWAFGLDAALARQVTLWQREYQTALARALRALRGGDLTATVSFLGICFAYGFFHALGPGHGKALIGAWAFATNTAARRMLVIAALSSLGQATAAVLLIRGGILLLGGARDRVEGLAAWLDPIAGIAIAAVGLILLWRGLRRLLPRPAAHDHDHDHDHDEDCGCGHAHTPDPAQVAQAKDWREAAALILGVALRPCTGALFLLILTWRLNLDGLGILGAYVMGFGTFMVTGAAAILAVFLRGRIHSHLPATRKAAPLVAAVEILCGTLIAVFALSLVLRGMVVSGL